MTLGEKIQTLRKQSGLSQEALAEKLVVTRQTISKWELDRSTPDLNFIIRLSELFQVSTDFLIKEDEILSDKAPAPKTFFPLSRAVKRRLLTGFSFLELAALFICLICDYFPSTQLSWSLIAATAMAAAWFVLLPVLAASENVLCKTLLAVSIVPFPLLAVLALLLKQPVVFTLGSCIALLCVASLWGIERIFLHFRAHLWRALGFSLLVVIPLSIAISHLAAFFLPQAQIEFTSDIFNSGVTLLLSLFCFGADHLHSQKQEAKR